MAKELPKERSVLPFQEKLALFQSTTKGKSNEAMSLGSSDDANRVRARKEVANRVTPITPQAPCLPNLNTSENIPRVEQDDQNKSRAVIVDCDSSDDRSSGALGTSRISSVCTWKFWGGKKWEDWDPETSKHLEDCFQQRLHDVEVSRRDGAMTYRVNLKEMIQTNVATGNSRAICRQALHDTSTSKLTLHPNGDENRGQLILDLLSKFLRQRNMKINSAALEYFKSAKEKGEGLGNQGQMGDSKDSIDSNEDAYPMLAEIVGLIEEGDAAAGTHLCTAMDEIEQLSLSNQEMEEKLRFSKLQKLKEAEFMQTALEKISKDKDIEAELRVAKILKERQKLWEEHSKLQEMHVNLKRELEKTTIKKSDCSFEVDYDPPDTWRSELNRIDSVDPKDLHFEILLNRDSDEFRMLERLMNQNIANHGTNYGTVDGGEYSMGSVTAALGAKRTNGIPPKAFKIVQINRIHDKRLWMSYCVYKQQLIEKFRHVGGVPNLTSSKYLKKRPMLTPLLDPESNEYWLFHGTSIESTEILISYPGYDSRVGKVTGMFGGGFYLAENSSKSNQYIPCPQCGGNAVFAGTGCAHHCRKGTKQYVMIIYRASLGDVHIAKEYESATYKGDKAKPVRRPPIKDDRTPYDSVLGERISNLTANTTPLHFREIILYDDARAAYPEYIVQYERLAEVSDDLQGIVTVDEWDSADCSKSSVYDIFQHLVRRTRTRQV